MRFKQVCGGGLRARAEQTTGDPWAADPGCYLTDEERSRRAGPAVSIGRCGRGPACGDSPFEAGSNGTRISSEFRAAKFELNPMAKTHPDRRRRRGASASPCAELLTRGRLSRSLKAAMAKCRPMNCSCGPLDRWTWSSPDVRMPEMDGLTLLGHAAADRAADAGHHAHRLWHGRNRRGGHAAPGPWITCSSPRSSTMCS